LRSDPGGFTGQQVAELCRLVPVLALAIKSASLARIAATLVEGISNAYEVVLEESSHTPVLEETERYLEAISVFMRQCE